MLDIAKHIAFQHPHHTSADTRTAKEKNLSIWPFISPSHPDNEQLSANFQCKSSWDEACGALIHKILIAMTG